jgi:hypothetical protein
MLTPEIQLQLSESDNGKLCLCWKDRKEPFEDRKDKIFKKIRKNFSELYELYRVFLQDEILKELNEKLGDDDNEEMTKSILRTWTEELEDIISKDKSWLYRMIGEENHANS